MFSKELENLIEATLADGILEDHEKAALVKRAQKEGVDLDELEIYIQSIIQKRIQNQKIQIEKETEANEKERRGNVCPHCATLIPPMTKICPNCGQAVNSNETSGDKELFKLIDDICSAVTKVKSSPSRQSFVAAKAECESLLKKADLFYGSNQKIQMLKFELEGEIKKVEQKFVVPIHVRILFTIVWFFVFMFGIGCWFIPFIFKGYRNFLSLCWNKVLGKV